MDETQLLDDGDADLVVRRRVGGMRPPTRTLTPNQRPRRSDEITPKMDGAVDTVAPQMGGDGGQECSSDGLVICPPTPLLPAPKPQSQEAVVVAVVGAPSFGPQDVLGESWVSASEKDIAAADQPPVMAGEGVAVGLLVEVEVKAH